MNFPATGPDTFGRFRRVPEHNYQRDQTNRSVYAQYIGLDGDRSTGRTRPIKFYSDKHISREKLRRLDRNFFSALFVSFVLMATGAVAVIHFLGRDLDKDRHPHQPQVPTTNEIPVRSLGSPSHGQGRKVPAFWAARGEQCG